MLMKLLELPLVAMAAIGFAAVGAFADDDDGHDRGRAVQRS